MQVWWMESDVDRYRTLHGVQGGEVVASEWTYPEAKNVGRANATTTEEQTKVEVKATYKKKLAQGKYSETDDFAALADAQDSYISPMLAEKLDVDRIDEHFYIQPKFNGVRCIATKDGLWSRKGKQFVNCPHIEEQLAEFFKDNPDAILDGELYNHDFKNDFNSLVSAIRKQKPTPETHKLAVDTVRYYLYDLPSSKDNFGERFNQLEGYYIGYFNEKPAFELSPTFRSRDIKTAQGLHERNKANGFEGSIVRLDVPYQFKRTHALMKYKDFQDAEYEILDVEEGKGNWSGVAKKVKLRLPSGVTSAAGNDYFHAGVKGDKEYCKRLLDNKSDLIGKQGTIVFFELSPDSVPIFPIFQTVRDYE
jgi:DNA ligase-1